MNKAMMTLGKTLFNAPATSYNPLNIIGEYFEYKKAIAMVEHETQKVLVQKEIILKQIESQLVLELAKNETNYRLERDRLEIIYASLKNLAIERSQIVNAIIDASRRGEIEMVIALKDILKHNDEVSNQRFDGLNPSNRLIQITQGV
ncbi:MAG: hypothetical protein KU38_13415 [Sulfurovum sp. FS08-3]|nr:MAG: hypothetical protein KU38_13415 [Sulfurovum sp. FS08-3]